ncbi:MAG: 3-deoxy-D-manno-octulosonic acid transferase [Phycisphaerales bacterium]|nr:3-deoxy-D-manno-octulosonic acid transferase [Phycisphaerales bacterium]
MPSLYDLAYAAGLGLTAPFWLLAPSARRKVLGALRARTGNDIPERYGPPAILIHAVSVGEVNSTPSLIAELRRRVRGLEFVVSTTTETGLERGRQLFAASPDVLVVRFPLDLTFAISRLLDRIRPSLVVLMELEVWPNFLRQCGKRGIPVVVAAGRITETAFRRYRRLGPVARAMFSRLSAVAAQDQVYAGRFEALGVPRERIAVLGTMKFDNAALVDRVEGADELARELGLRPDAEPILVAGSTGPGEEEILLSVYRRLLADHPALRLVIVPRHPPRFDEAARLIRAAGFTCLRRSAARSGSPPLEPAPRPEADRPAAFNSTSAEARSESTAASPPAAESVSVSTMGQLRPPVVLGDTMGELRKFYSLATVVFVGRSLVDLGPRQHGSDMIEPAALARPTIVGPYTSNFDMPVRRFREAGAIVEVTTAEALLQAVHQLLCDADYRARLGQRAREVVRAEQGSTGRHVELIVKTLPADGR